jgi:hypothetical protein
MSNEAKTTKAYKVSPDLKEKLETLFAESGMETQEAFIDHIATLYEMQQLKDGHAAGYKKQLDELEYHTRRSVELFLGMIETEAAERLQSAQEHEEALAERTSVILGQEQEITELKKEVKHQADELAKLTKENQARVQQIEQLSEISRKDNLLVDEYRQRIDTLSGLVNEYKAAGEENQELKAKVSELTLLTEKQAAKITSLERDIAILKEVQEEQLRQREERHREALERLTERKDVERERDLLALRTEYQAKLEKANEDATAKLRELYEQIRELQQPKKTEDDQNS